MFSSRYYVAAGQGCIVNVVQWLQVWVGAKKPSKSTQCHTDGSKLGVQ